MKFSERAAYAQALSDSFSEDELRAMLKRCLESGLNGKVTSWSDVGLSSSIAFDFQIGTAVDILSAAIRIKVGSWKPQSQSIKKFVL
jgi:hypothetical protein